MRGSALGPLVVLLLLVLAAAALAQEDPKVPDAGVIIEDATAVPEDTAALRTLLRVTA